MNLWNVPWLEAAVAVANGRPQFFPAVYRRSVGAIARKLLHEDQRSLAALINACRARYVPESQVIACDPALDSFFRSNHLAYFA